MADPFFPRILVPVDFSACSEEAFRVATHLARQFEAELILLHVVDTRSLGVLNRLGLALPSEEKTQLRKLRHQARLLTRRIINSDALKGVSVKRFIAEGAPFAEIARFVRSEKISLVVMGSYGGAYGGVDKIFFGSTAEKVVRTAGCPVLTVPLMARPVKAGGGTGSKRGAP
jgi:nucleotide-binding universal stress UspA family protein